MILAAIVIGLSLIFLLIKEDVRFTNIAEFGLVLGVVIFFLNHSLYVAVCILVLHALALFQFNQTQSLLGFVPVVSTAGKKIQAGLVMVVLAVSIGRGLQRKGINIDGLPSPLDAKKLVSLSTGEMFPFVVALCLLCAVTVLGLVSENRKR